MVSSLRIYWPEYKTTISLALPIVLSQAGHMLMGIFDNAMVGRVGVTPLAAASFANGVFANFMILGIGFAYGLTPLIGNALGNQDNQAIARYFKNGLVTFLAVGVFLSLFLFFGAPLLVYFDQPQAVVEQAIPYFRTLAVSMLPLMLFLAAKQFAEGLGETKPGLAFTFAGNIINIAFNYVLIFGKFGFEPMGLLGAGIATLASRIFMGIGFYIYVIKAERFKAYILPAQVAWDKIKELIKIGVPIAFQFVFEVAAFSIGTIMMGWIGEKELAAHQIALNLAGLSYMMASGIAAANTIRTSQYTGMGDAKMVRKAGFAGIHLALVFMFLCAMFFVAMRQILPTWFITNTDVIRISGTLLIIAAFFQLFDGLQVTALGALRGMKDVKIPTYITAVAYWVVSLPVGYILAFTFGQKEMGIWYGYLIGLGISAMLLLWRFYYVSGKIEKSLPHAEAPDPNAATAIYH